MEYIWLSMWIGIFCLGFTGMKWFFGFGTENHWTTWEYFQAKKKNK